MAKTDQPEFIDRIYNPENYPYIVNDDGSVSTHRMAAEYDEQEKKWYVFPTIQFIKGKLVEFEDNFEALTQAKKTNNFLIKPKKEALEYAKGGYKEKTPLVLFDPVKKAKTAKTFIDAL